jgi:hypothetical protein
MTGSQSVLAIIPGIKLSAGSRAAVGPVIILFKMVQY